MWHLSSCVFVFCIEQSNDWHSLEQGISFYLKQIVRDAVQERVSAKWSSVIWKSYETEFLKVNAEEML